MSSYDTKIVNNTKRNAEICNTVAAILEKSMPGILFVKRVAHAKLMARMLTAALGFEVPCITGTLSETNRANVANRLRDEQSGLTLAVATMVWATGLDIPRLEWIFWAGAGKAPISLLQGAGRPLRTSEDKAHFTIYDLQDYDGSNYEAQAEKRISHYSGAGFRVTQSDQDATVLEELLATKPDPKIKSMRTSTSRYPQKLERQTAIMQVGSRQMASSQASSVQAQRTQMMQSVPQTVTTLETYIDKLPLIMATVILLAIIIGIFQ